MSEIPQEQFDVIFYHGAYPLWVYLQEILGINIVDVCSRVTKEEPILTTTNGKLAVRMVDNDYSVELPPIHNNDIIFLVNSINVVFESLKEGIEKNEEKLLKPYKFKLHKNNVMTLINIESNDPVSSKSLAVVLI